MSQIPYTKVSIIDALRDRFPREPVPSREADEFLASNCRCYECLEVLEILGGRQWPKVADEEVLRATVGLHVISENALAYYLPAFMRVLVCGNEDDATHEFMETTFATMVLDLTPEKGNVNKEKPLLQRVLMRLSREQREVVLVVMEMIKTKYIHDGTWSDEQGIWDDEEAKASYLAMLQQDWAKDLCQVSLGVREWPIAQLLRPL